jgi:hypothetical protein
MISKKYCHRFTDLKLGRRNYDWKRIIDTDSQINRRRRIMIRKELLQQIHRIEWRGCCHRFTDLGEVIILETNCCHRFTD